MEDELKNQIKANEHRWTELKLVSVVIKKEFHDQSKFSIDSV